MKEATGSSVTIFIIAIFIVITMGYLAFNVNYTKAFRMKDKIISIYDDRKGNCDGSCEDEIAKYAKSIGYNTGNTINCNKVGYSNAASSGLYCYTKVDAHTSESADAVKDSKPSYYYKISTKIYLEIPIISNMLNFKVFYITGDTKVFTKD